MGPARSRPPARRRVMRFPYAGYTIRGTVPNSKALVFRPMVPVRVIGPTGDRDVFGRVDSGADDTMLPAAVAGAIGVTGLTPAVAIGGIGGNVLASFGTVDLEISDGQTVYRWQAYVGFCSHTLP